MRKMGCGKIEEDLTTFEKLSNLNAVGLGFFYQRFNLGGHFGGNWRAMYALGMLGGNGQYFFFSFGGDYGGAIEAGI